MMGCVYWVERGGKMLYVKPVDIVISNILVRAFCMSLFDETGLGVQLSLATS